MVSIGVFPPNDRRSIFTRKFPQFDGVALMLFRQLTLTLDDYIPLPDLAYTVLFHRRLNTL